MKNLIFPPSSGSVRMERLFLVDTRFLRASNWASKSLRARSEAGDGGFGSAPDAVSVAAAGTRGAAVPLVVGSASRTKPESGRQFSSAL
jgi:hypothetical protein